MIISFAFILLAGIFVVPGVSAEEGGEVPCVNECDTSEDCSEGQACIVESSGCTHCGSRWGVSDTPTIPTRTGLRGLFKKAGTAPKVSATRSARFGVAAGTCPSGWGVTNAASGGSCCLKPSRRMTGSLFR